MLFVFLRYGWIVGSLQAGVDMGYSLVVGGVLQQVQILPSHIEKLPAGSVLFLVVNSLRSDRMSSSGLPSLFSLQKEIEATVIPFVLPSLAQHQL
ncbi:hypothetical protein [Pajaroellobacter abortibovis]|uniref:hypothetical protein n=1 Tax=Pajaroellobacter abortibovis TaxID=1882918 RepID=UPI0012EBB69E|nr:hypothetical protein [Pajaroellobacter abortibovis]